VYTPIHTDEKAVRWVGGKKGRNREEARRKALGNFFPPLLKVRGKFPASTRVDSERRRNGP